MCKKTEGLMCPNCGDFDSKIIDYEIDIDSVCYKMYCRCGCIWKEYFKLLYDGYSDKNGIYDKFGGKE